MKPAPFEMIRPTSLDEAMRLLSAHQDDTRVIAGGQSLVPLMNFRLATPAILVDLNPIAALSGIVHDGSWLRIGAMTRQQQLLTDPLVRQCAPLLAAAAAHVGHIQTRSRGTVGGSLAQADPSAEIPLALVALGATIVARSVRGSREVAACSFFRDAMITDLEADEILTEIKVPLSQPTARVSFREYARRHGDFAIVAVAFRFDPPDISLAVGGLESVPRLCSQVMDVVRANPSSLTAIQSAVDEELAGAIPNADLQAGAQFRRRLASVLVMDCLREVLAL